MGRCSIVHIYGLITLVATTVVVQCTDQVSYEAEYVDAVDGLIVADSNIRLKWCMPSYLDLYPFRYRCFHNGQEIVHVTMMGDSTFVYHNATHRNSRYYWTSRYAYQNCMGIVIIHAQPSDAGVFSCECAWKHYTAYGHITLWNEPEAVHIWSALFVVVVCVLLLVCICKSTPTKAYISV